MALSACEVSSQWVSALALLAQPDVVFDLVSWPTQVRTAFAQGVFAPRERFCCFLFMNRFFFR